MNFAFEFAQLEDVFGLRSLNQVGNIQTVKFISSRAIPFPEDPNICTCNMLLEADDDESKEALKLNKKKLVLKPMYPNVCLVYAHIYMV